MPQYEMIDGELFDTNTDTLVADETSVSIATACVAALNRYDNARALFVEDREVRKVNGQSNRLIMEKVGRVKVTDEIRGAYSDALTDFMARIDELKDESAGVLSLLFADCQKGGRIYDYLIGEATEVAKGLTLTGVVPSIEELQKMATKVRGLWTALTASVDSIEVIKALGVPCEITNKGRSDGTTYVVSMKELPKVPKASEPNEIAILFCDGKEIWRTNSNNVTISNALSVSVKGVKFTDFERQMQLSQKIDDEGNPILDSDGNPQQQDIWSVNFELKGHTFKSERVKLSS